MLDENQNVYKGGLESFSASLYGLVIKDSRKKKNNTAVDIQLKTLVNSHTASVTIFPLDHQNQEKLENLAAGYYVLEIVDSKTDRILGGWVLSISNSDKPDLVSQFDFDFNFFIPSFLTIQAGHPFTFNCELSGSTTKDLTKIEKELKIAETK